jgi:NitT/TauT family transport system ATP-binding protein
MTAGPDARFKTIVRVDIAHPRDLTAPAAVALYRELREDIASEVRRTLQAQGLARDAA